MRFLSLSHDDTLRRLGYAEASVLAHGVRFAAGTSEGVEEELAEEVPVTMAYNGSAHAVMMATPADLEDFAVGFSLTEGIVASASAISGVAVVRQGRAIELQLEVPAQVAAEALSRSRRLSGRTGCGICGTEQVDQVLRAVPSVQGTGSIDAAAIGRAMRALAGAQPLNARTGAVHAAGWATIDGALALVREDVGRHNALDKLVGALVRGRIDTAGGFVVLTSRGSFELVQKTAILGAPLLACVSAPTALAVRVAHAAGVTLVAFARDDRLTAYAHPERVRGSAAGAP
jgi:FdhD protein